MSKKFTMLLAALLAFVGVAKAQYYVIESVGENITDLSALTEDSYVALYNVGKSKYIYEGGNHKLCMGTAAEAGAGHEYIWQVHKDGDTFLFTSASGRYFSTPLDGKDVYTVKSDNAAKDKFTITAHSEDKTKWLVKSSNANIYWDAQNDRFVGWAGNGTNSRYEIRPVTVSAAAENDFNKLITTNEDDINIKWYAIKNVKSGKYATYAGDAATMTQQAAISGPSLFYFTGRATADGATVGIHNLFAGDNLCAEYNSWTATGREWLISKQSTGLSIAYPNNANKAWNNANGWGNEVAYWGASDGGSAWQIEIVTDFTEYLTAAKAAAILEIDKLSGVSAIYANVAEQFKTEIGGVTENSAESLLAVNNILENYRKTIDGKSMKFRVDGRGSRFLGYNKTSNRAETLVLGFDDAYWTLKYVGNGYFKLYNPVNNVWLGAPDSKWDEREVEEEDAEGNKTTKVVKENYRTPGLATESEASLYKFEVTNGGTTVLLVAGNGNIAHAAGDHHIMSYGSKTDQASWWAITDVVTFSMTYDEYKEFLTKKSTLMNQLIGYAKQLQDNSGLVKSDDKIAVVVNHPSGDDSQPSSNLLDGNNSTFVHSAYSNDDPNVTNHYIEVELSEATQNIFCYFSKRNNNNRPSVIKVLAGNSADALNEVATLNLPESADGSVQGFFSGAIDLGAAYTHLRFVVTKTNTNTKYFTLSEFYVLPVNTTTEGIAALAGASIVDTDLEARLTAADKSLKNLQLPETLAEVKAALDANVSNHADKPQLGQYTTAAYNELKAAYDACTTIDQLDAVFAAFDKFNKAKNLPVFMISNGNVKDYAKDKSIYDDNSGTLHFKTTDMFDNTMWWALDQVETTVSVTGDNYVGIYNVGTGNGFLGAASIKVTETNENDGAGISDDDLFLIYKNGGSHPAHFQETGSSIVEYWSYEATSGSAAKFTYIGNTYDLNKLTPEFVEKIEELTVAFDAKAALYNAMYDGLKVSLGTGVGQYKGDDESFAEIMTTASVLLSKDLIFQLQNTTVADLETYIATINGFALNMPVEGNYYRIKGANDGKQNYLTGNVTANGNRIALQADATDATIFQYVGGKLLAVESNLYVDLKNWTFQILASKAENTEFAASTRNFNAYTIKCGSFFHYNNDYLNRCGSDNCTEHDWLLEEVDAASVPANNNLLTDLANLNGASFRIYGERGFIYVADGVLKSTYGVSTPAFAPNNNNYHFAFVKIGESNYLYNVGAQKFVAKKDATVTLTDYPEHAVVVAAATNQSTTYDWTIAVNSKLLNLTNAGGHAHGVYTSYDTEDEGNRWALYTAGTFDQTEAAKMRKVTVNYTLGEKTMTKNFGKKVGETFDVPSFDLATITSCKKGEEDVPANNGAYSVEISDAVTINVTIEENLPFKAVAEGTPTTWYYAQMHATYGEGFYVSADKNDKMVWYGNINADSAKYVAGEVVPDSCLWGFAGNVVEGFKMVNKAETKAVISTGDGDVTMGELANATAFELKTSQAGGGWFCLKNGKFLNLNTGNKVLQHWNANDQGSSIFVTEYNKEYSLNLEIGYATFYSQYRVAIPEGVQAWVVSSIENNEVVLDEVTEGVLPANTGVILTGEGTPSIVTSAAKTANVGTNLLRGTVTKTLIEAAANTSYYVLANGENGVKLYKAKVNKNAEGAEGTSHFYNNANRVYLPIEVATPQAAQALAFRFRGKEQGTTEIEVPATNDLQPAVIYDLTGRRITEIVEKGIYIVNGKKVVIK